MKELSEKDIKKANISEGPGISKYLSALKDCEDNYYNLYNSLPDSVIRIDPDGFIQECNNSGLDFLKITRKEIIGKHLTDFMHKSSLPVFKEKFPKMMETGFAEGEVKIKTKRGTYIDVWRKGVRLDDIKDNLVGALIVDRNLSEKKKAENEVLKFQEILKENEKKFHTIYEYSSDAIMLLAPPEWNFTAGNPSTLKLFKAKDEAEFLAFEPWKLSPEFQPDGTPSSEKAPLMIKRAMEAGSNFFEWTHKKISGEEFPATVLLSQITLNRKKLLQATVRDITSQKEAENELISSKKKIEKLVKLRTKELHESEENYKLIFENTTDIYYRSDKNRVITSINPAAVKLFGARNSEELIGLNSGNFYFDPEDSRIFGEELEKTGSVERYLLKLKKSDGTPIFVETNSKVLYNEEGEFDGIVGVMRDVTERLEHEKQLASQKEHIELINKILRHDLSNNLAVIKSAIGLYKKGKDISILDEASNRCLSGSQLISKMRNLQYVIDPGNKLRPMEVSKILEGVKKNYISVQISVKGRTYVMADDTLISVLDNIISNSIERGKATEIEIKLTEQNTKSIISIADNGIGIPEKVKEQIFDEEFIHGTSGHTGIGLYIVKKAINNYGGSVSLEDNKLEGATFVLELNKANIK
jgi:PAS domain S-box-containing protein